MPVVGRNYEYIYCLWVAGSFKGKGIGRELLEYAISNARKKGDGMKRHTGEADRAGVRGHFLQNVI